jgi:ubiquinone/menaquinone biosynthesis C-methylase UbiE
MVTTSTPPTVHFGIEGNVREADRVLVLGPADCAFSAARLAGIAGRVIGVGPAGAELAAAEAQRRRDGWFGLEFREAAGPSLPADDGSLDAVVLARPVALSRRRGALMYEIARTLRGDGRLVVA